ncbi:MAG: hypothetical protein Q9159_002807 [Coniocarpon cinnabarinum]
MKELANLPVEYASIYRHVVTKSTALVGAAGEGPERSAERTGGIYALMQLMQFKGDDVAQKTTRFAASLRTVMKGNDTGAMVLAAKALGILAKPQNPLCSELVDAEVKVALESLQVERQEHRRFAAVLILQELAESSPTLLYQYVNAILEVIWVALRDPKVLIRESTAGAMSSIFQIIADRDVLLRDQWFARVYNEIFKGFVLNTPETTHGSLLALNQLLDRGGMFMQSGSRYADACDKVFALKDHRDLLIRKQVTMIIPILAAYYPQEFGSAYLHKFMMHLQGLLKREKDRDLAFVAIGKVATAVGSAVEPYLDGILVYVREGLSIKARTKTFNDAPIFQCISMVAIAVGQTLTKYMDALLDPIFACGLSGPLVQALVDMAHYIPPARPTIQEKLLDLLSKVLSGKPFSPLGSPNQNSIVTSVTRDLRDPTQSEQREAEIELALTTLGSFNFSGYILNEFVRDVAIRYVEDDRASTRRAAALTCCQLFINDPSVKQVSRHAMQVVSNVIERLLTVAVADPVPDIRHVILTSLVSRFDKHLAKAENIRSLFLCLNDEYFPNREASMAIIGRLTSVNPAYVFPSLRKVLIQLLTEIEYTTTPKAKQESAKLVSNLVSSSSRLIKPYVDPMVAVLLPKTQDLDETVAATSLKAVGDLAVVGGEDMCKYIDTLMQTIMIYLVDQGSLQKRFAALKTLGQLAGNAGYVIEPYIHHPDLLGILMGIVSGEPPGELRLETIRVMGILGAFDPYKYQMLVEGSPENNLANDSKGINDVSLIINGQRPEHEEFYPTIVIYTLMDLLHDPTLTQYHSNVIEAVMNIYATMGLKCVNFLGKVIPGFILVIKNATPAGAEGYFSQLSQLVRIVRLHIRPYLHPILDIVQTFWTERREALATMLTLIESIARSLEGDFKVYLARVLPMMLDILRDDRTQKRIPSERILRAFLVFGSSAEEYMHLIIPTVVRLFDKQSNPTHIRKQAIETLGRISRKVNLSEFASRMIHPLCRILAQPGPDLQLRATALDALAALVFHLGPDYLSFIPMVNKVLTTNRIPHQTYGTLVEKLQKGEPLPQNLNPDARYGEDEDQNRPAEISSKPLAVNQEHLKTAWETSQRSTREDWLEWIKRLNIELLKESPNHALRACAPLASVHIPTARALFNSAFASCYTLLFQNFQRDLVTNIESALSAPLIPPEILQQLLNLCEFMEHDDKALPIDVRALGGCAGRCHAFAKALHWKELEYNADQSPSAVNSLISINNNLQQTDAAFGILKRAHQYTEVDVQENWYEKLGRYEDALRSFQRREEEEPESFEVMYGKMRCLHALGEWDVLASLAEDKWSRAAADGRQKQIAPLAAAAAWGLHQWELVDKYMSAMRIESPDRSFFGAILSIHRDQFEAAQKFVKQARDALDAELSTVIGESYSRAYNVVVRTQMLAELEEIIVYKQNDEDPAKRSIMRQTWVKRLKGCQRNVETWHRMLSVRALVMKPSENEEMLIKFANLCRKSSRWGLAEKTLKSLMTDENEPSDEDQTSSVISPAVNYARLKFAWAHGDHEKSLASLQSFTLQLKEEYTAKSKQENVSAATQYANGVNGISGNYGALGGSNFVNGYDMGSMSRPDPGTAKQLAEWQKLLARCHFKQGQWQTVLQKGDWAHEQVHEVLNSYAAATNHDPKWHKAWHAFALSNFEVVTALTGATGPDRDAADVPTAKIVARVAPAIRGFFKSIALTATSTLQDTLRILTLWFAHGAHVEVSTAVTEGISSVSVDTWLEVIPQLIARINQHSPRVRQLIHTLLCEVGRAHPQALVFPLTVSIKSEVTHRSRSAQAIMDNLRQHSPRLVEQAELVSRELIRIAVLWHEQWHEGLEEASRLYFGERNVVGMFGVLEPLHDMIDRGPQTLREVSFIQTFGRDLHEAREFCNAFKQSGDDGELNSAWDVYYQVFKKIAKQNTQIQNLELTYVSPALKDAKDLDLAVPGTYQSGKSVISIESFESTAFVIQSKQRPRRFCLRGSDGNVHTFLLKGHEDIRQDERVMQLFGLVNTLLQNDAECTKRHLSIQRYSAIPLSTQSGLLGWVPNSDTLHALIRDYREHRNILLNIEHRIMLQMAPDYDMLSLMQKVEVFSYAMDNTTGQDLYRVLWLKSKSSEAWLDRRTNYIRSLGVMSMVGYILGLGDRHPSNLMLDRVTGKIVHIDFGDCFEVAMHREKYPERVPFRLTRMLTFAMEVSNIEGSFRTTCENVMRVLRDNKESLMAVLEAFVHDPLLTWRLNTRESPPEPSFRSERRESLFGVGNPEAGVNAERMNHPAITGSLSGRPPGRHRSSTTGTRPTGLSSATAGVNGTLGNALAGAGAATFEGKGTEQQNQRALQVLSRVKEKLTGRDFNRPPSVNTPQPSEPLELDVEEQVERLILEATNLENLCQHYIGWCSFW